MPLITYTGAPQRAGRLTLSERNEAAACVARGESPVAVAARYGITPSGLRCLCRARGVGPRTSWNANRARGERGMWVRT